MSIEVKTHQHGVRVIFNADVRIDEIKRVLRLLYGMYRVYHSKTYKVNFDYFSAIYDASDAIIITLRYLDALARASEAGMTRALYVCFQSRMARVANLCVRIKIMSKDQYPVIREAAVVKVFDVERRVKHFVVMNTASSEDLRLLLNNLNKMILDEIFAAVGVTS